MDEAKRTCPSCGEPVYPSDTVCMSCGAQLTKGAAPASTPGPGARGPTPSPPSRPLTPAGTPAPPPPMAPPPPVIGGRRPARPRPDPPFYHAIVEGLGGFWDIFPWIGLAFYIGSRSMGFLHVSPVAALVLLVCALVWNLTYIFWVIFDVLYFSAEWWWILVSILCYPIGLVLYLVKGRPV